MHNSLLSLPRWVAMASPLLLFSLVPVIFADGQGNQSQSAPAANSQTRTAKDYEIGPGDVLAITVTDAPEFSGKFRVDETGYLVMSSLPSPVKAQGRTTMQLSKDLTRALETAKLYRDPTVNIFVEEYHSRTVSVVGAVSKPGLYPLQRRTTVMEVVSQAGLLPTAGNQITILPAGEVSMGDPAAASSVQKFDLGKLMSGKDPTINIEVHDGEVVSVSSAEVVYVVGAVTKPGGFVFQDRSAGITALQAIALAEGMTPVASPRRGLILRQNPDGGERENLSIDLSKIMSGKDKDVSLAANDILFVPVSGSKQTLRTMGQVALSAVNGAVFYGVGYRAGGL